LKKLSFVILAAWCIISFSVASVYAINISPGIERIKKKGTLVVAMYFEDVPPFFVTKSDGAITGIDADIARLIADMMDVKLVFNRDAKTFNKLVTLVAERKADLAISVLSRTVERAYYVNFTEPYITMSQALILNRLLLARIKVGKNIVASIDLPQSVIGVVKGSSYVEYANALFAHAQVRKYETWKEVEKDVLNAKILAGLYDEIEVKHLLKTQESATLYIKPVVLHGVSDDISIAVNYEDAHLLQWLNVFIDTIKKNNILKRIEERSRQ